MKRGIVLLAALLLGVSCARVELSESSRAWLKNYEAVVDEYLQYLNTQVSNTGESTSHSADLEQKISRLSREAGEIRKKLTPGEALPFYKEFSRITAKMAVKMKAPALE